MKRRNMNTNIIEHQGNTVQEIQPIAPTVENLRTFLKVPDGERVERANDPVWFSSPAPQGFYWKIKDHNNGAISISQHTPITGAYTECSGRFIRYLDEDSRVSADMLRQQKNAAMSKYGYKAFGR